MENKILSEVIEKLEQVVGDEHEVSLDNFVKNNDTHLLGILIRKKGEKIGKIYYVRDFVKYGRTVDDIIINITHDYFSKDEDSTCIYGMIDGFMNFEVAKKHLFPRLISKNRNVELLSHCEYRDFLDLAVIIVYEITLPGGMMSIKINHSILNSWKTTFDEVYEIAINNMEKMDSWSIRNINDVIRDLSGLSLDFYELDMYVVTLSNGINGARCLLNSNVINNLIGEFGGSFVVLPSSIHEILVVPTDIANITLRGFNDIVQSVNADDVVKDEDVLSDHAYIYDSEKGWSW